MKHLLLVVPLVLLSCSAPAPSQRINSSNEEAAVASLATPKSLRHAYWPPDYDIQRSQAIVPGPAHYRVGVATSCLNDSAVVNPVVLDEGSALDISHNYESLLSINRGATVWQRVRLTKALFQHDPRVRTLGPLSSLVISRTAFLKYRAPAFYFTTRLGAPDSDIFLEAEVALVPNEGLQVIKIKRQVEME